LAASRSRRSLARVGAGIDMDHADDVPLGGIRQVVIEAVVAGDRFVGPSSKNGGVSPW